MRKHPRVFVIVLMAALSGQLITTPDAQSAATIPIIFKSVDVDGWTVPQNSMAISKTNRTVIDVFPPCNSTIKTDCIISVEYQDLTGKWIRGKFAQPMPYKINIIVNGNSSEQVIEETNNPISFKEDPSRNIPALSRSGYWSFPGLKQTGGDKFLVDFTAIADMSNIKDPLAQDSRAIWRGIQSVRIAPVTPLVLKTSSIKSKNPKGVPAFSGCGGYGKDDKAFCWKRNEFVGDPLFRINVRLNKTAELLNSTQWFTARVKSSTIGISKDSNGTILTFTGKPVVIGNAAANVPRTRSSYLLAMSLANIATKTYDPNFGLENIYPEKQFTEDDLEFSLSTETSASVKQWIALESVAQIGVAAENGVWRFTQAEMKQDSSVNTWNDKCTSIGGVLGMASSNAAVFVPTIPTWNAENSSLDFQIASTHLNKSGKLNTGYYGISVSESAAKCLWGVNSTKISARISITSPDEEKIINLSSSSTTGGYYNFNVSGFHYSAPKISLKIQNP